MAQCSASKIGPLGLFHVCQMSEEGKVQTCRAPSCSAVTAGICNASTNLSTSRLAGKTKYELFPLFFSSGDYQFDSTRQWELHLVASCIQ